MRLFWRRKTRKIRRLFTIQFFIGIVLSVLIILPIKFCNSKDPDLTNLDQEKMELQIELMETLTDLIEKLMKEY